MARDLLRIGKKARKSPQERFTSLYHYLYDLEYLIWSYSLVKRGKAPGVDGETVEEYGKDLRVKLMDLAERLVRMGYRPQPVLRCYIPKPGSAKKRPLGIPTASA